MKYDFDSYLLYERNRSVGFTVRIRVVMKDEVRHEILEPAAVKAFKRYPYYSQTVSVDDSGAYILHPCDAPIAVMPDEPPVKLGGEETNGLLFAITDRDRAMLSPAPAHRIIIIVFHKKDWYNIRLSVFFLRTKLKLEAGCGKKRQKEKEQLHCQSALRLRTYI